MQGKCSVLIGGEEECLLMGVSSVGGQSMQIFICVVCLMKKEEAASFEASTSFS